MLLVGGYNQDESELINAKMLASFFLSLNCLRFHRVVVCLSNN